MDDCAHKILPVLCGLTVDPAKSVRDQVRQPGQTWGLGLGTSTLPEAWPHLGNAGALSVASGSSTGL